MDVTQPHEFTGSGAMNVTKPYEFIGFGAMDVSKPYELIIFQAKVVNTIKRRGTLSKTARQCFAPPWGMVRCMFGRVWLSLEA